MLKKILLFSALASLFFSCNNNSPEGGGTSEALQEQTDSTELEAGSEADGKHFGEGISMQGAISFGEMLDRMQGLDSLAVKVAGTVEEVCQEKGCWMNIVSEDVEGRQQMFVQFKDYGFFMPKDIAGREVVMEGYAYRALTPVDELRHFAEDAGKSQEEIDAITEPKEELKFLASGVLLMDEGE